MDQDKLRERYSKAEIDEILADDPDEAPTEWVPSRFEKRINAIPEGRWTLYQLLGGALIGSLVVATLFAGGKGFSWSFLVSVVLALLLPNWLEDRGRRKLFKLRYAMIAVMAIGIIAMVIYNGVTKGWDVFAPKAAEEAARFIAPWSRL